MVEIVATPNQEIPELPYLTFEFFDETDCLWSGQVYRVFVLWADWGNQCEATAVEHSGNGVHFLEYKLCDSENTCPPGKHCKLCSDSAVAGMPGFARPTNGFIDLNESKPWI